MAQKKEIWKDIPNYEGYYQASDLGRVRSLDRTVVYKDGRERYCKGRVVWEDMSNGYRRTVLSINGINKRFKFSQLVAMAFLNHTPNGHALVVDHINGDKADDRLINLRIVTQKENLSSCYRSDKKNKDCSLKADKYKPNLTSRYKGVGFHRRDKKWQSRVTINGKRKHLGYFNTELEAHKAYQDALTNDHNE